MACHCWRASFIPGEAAPSIPPASDLMELHLLFSHIASVQSPSSSVHGLFIGFFGTAVECVLVAFLYLISPLSYQLNSRHFTPAFFPPRHSSFLSHRSFWFRKGSSRFSLGLYFSFFRLPLFHRNRLTSIHHPLPCHRQSHIPSPDPFFLGLFTGLLRRTDPP